MKTQSKEQLIQHLKASLERLQIRSKSIEEKTEQVSRYRLTVFLLGFVLTWLVFQFVHPTVGLAVFVGTIGLFIYLVNEHKKLDRATKVFNYYIQLRKNQVARIQLDWGNLPKEEILDKDPDHPFENDLVITGDRSLHRLLNNTITQGGSKRLAEILLQKVPNVEESKKRQKIVQILSKRRHFREKLGFSAGLDLEESQNNRLEIESLAKWVEARNEAQTSLKSKIAIAGGISLINFVLIALNLISLLPAYWLIGLIVNYIVINIFAKDSAHLLADSDKINETLSSFGLMLFFLEKYPIKKEDPLYDFLKIYKEGEHKPSAKLSQITRITAAAALTQGNGLVGLLINLFVPWDLYFTDKLNFYVGKLSHSLPLWVTNFYELEALNALAEFSWLNPNYTYASFAESDEAVFEGEDIGHPMIAYENKVTNSFTISSIGECVLLTGSNMSGKSTFLRTLGVNMILAYAGAPVNAKSLKLKPAQLFSCINVSDSLADGFSYFYAEVRRLRMLLGAVKEQKDYPVFYLIDEIFRGTNNKERLIGSMAFVEALANEKGYGLVSTHDLELVNLEKKVPLLKNYHFRETIVEGKMHFEYKIRTGPSPTTNALRIMEIEGLPVKADK